MRIQEVLMHLVKLAIGMACARKVHICAQQTARGKAVHFSESSSGAMADENTVDAGAAVGNSAL